MVSSRIAADMSQSGQMEVHYINTGFPYTVTESLLDLFEDLTYPQPDANLGEAFQDQGNAYWSTVHASPYKYGFCSPASSSYYSFSQAYEMNGFTLQLDGSRCAWNDPAPLNIFYSPQCILHGNEDIETRRTPSTEECIPVHNNANDSRVNWQDNIDPDSMTYEELLDLGETVGTNSRGLSQEHISSLPVSKYKCSFFSKKSRRERCVICQMNYRRGDRQMTLPCKHAYHADCVTKWLIINKACPVCFVDVAVGEPATVRE